jgi:hypothetical protein
VTKPERVDAYKAASQDLHVVDSGELLSDSQMVLGWHEVVARHKQGGNVPGPFLMWPPTESKLTLSIWLTEGSLSEEAQQQLDGLRSFLSQLEGEAKHQPALLLIPLHSEGPLHWTLLVLQRQASGCFGDRWQLRYFDSLPSQSPTGTAMAQAALDVIRQELPPGQAEELPKVLAEFPRAHRQFQQDGWSCGLWTLQWQERELRLFSQEEPLALEPDVHIRRHAVNKFLQAVAASCMPLPPLPAPASEPAPEKEDSTKQKSTGFKPVGPPLSFEDTWGCSKCRGSKAGCKQCNPYKAAKGSSKPETIKAAAGFL